MNHNNGGGCVALLECPERTCICLDAGRTYTLRKSEAIIVIRDIVPSHRFHLLLVRGGLKPNSTDETSAHGQPAGLHNVGLAILFETFDQTSSTPWFVGRKFDSFTEELSSIPLDEATMDRIKISFENSRYVYGTNTPFPSITYKSLVQGSNLEESVDSLWSQYLTHHITRKLLTKHGISGFGDKILPSSYTIDDLEVPIDCKTPSDGIIMKYPAIPVIDRNITNNQKHKPTRNYLMSLSPEMRTHLLFYEDCPGSFIFDYVMENVYKGEWENLLGDLQLAFVLFLCLGCFTSFEHWRDLLTMLSLVSPVSINKHTKLFQELLRTLLGQLQRFDEDLFSDVEYAEGSFLYPTLSRISNICRRASINTNLIYLDEFERTVEEKTRFVISHDHDDYDHDDYQSKESDSDKSEDNMDDPVIVTFDEMEASLARIKKNPRSAVPIDDNSTMYPLLFAATLDHEDIIMACARILDESVEETSLLREARNYLENIEAKALI